MTALRIKLFPFAFRVHITSSKQRPDRFPPGVYATALFKIMHLMHAVISSTLLQTPNILAKFVSDEWL